MDDYADLKCHELTTRLRERGLWVTGVKKDLIQRLREDDREKKKAAAHNDPGKMERLKQLSTPFTLDDIDVEEEIDNVRKVCMAELEAIDVESSAANAKFDAARFEASEKLSSEIKAIEASKPQKLLQKNRVRVAELAALLRESADQGKDMSQTEAEEDSDSLFCREKTPEELEEPSVKTRETPFEVPSSVRSRSSTLAPEPSRRSEPTRRSEPSRRADTSPQTMSSSKRKAGANRSPRQAATPKRTKSGGTVNGQAASSRVQATSATKSIANSTGASNELISTGEASTSMRYTGTGRPRQAQGKGTSNRRLASPGSYSSRTVSEADRNDDVLPVATSSYMGNARPRQNGSNSLGSTPTQAATLGRGTTSTQANLNRKSSSSYIGSQSASKAGASKHSAPRSMQHPATPNSVPRRSPGSIFDSRQKGTPQTMNPAPRHSTPDLNRRSSNTSKSQSASKARSTKNSEGKTAPMRATTDLWNRDGPPTNLNQAFWGASTSRQASPDLDRRSSMFRNEYTAPASAPFVSRDHYAATQASTPTASQAHSARNNNLSRRQEAQPSDVEENVRRTLGKGHFIFISSQDFSATKGHAKFLLRFLGLSTVQDVRVDRTGHFIIFHTEGLSKSYAEKCYRDYNDVRCTFEGVRYVLKMVLESK